MRIFLLTAAFLFSGTQALAQIDCSKHKIYCKIKALRSDMSYEKAMGLSNVIYRNSRKKDDDPTLAIAIAMQETGLREISRSQKIIQFSEECNKKGCFESWSVSKGVSDVCMFQFHVNTILDYKIDPIKLRDDINYCVSWHFKLMRIKRKECKSLGHESWSCYHSNTKVLREHYIDLVERYR